MDSSDNGDMELLEPEELGAKEQLGDGANGAKEDVALHISNGPMTRSKTRLLNQAITTLLHQIQGSLKQDACPATLVVIQAVQATTMENQAWKFKGIPQPLEVLFDPSSSSPLDLTRFTPPDPPEQTYSSTLTRPLEYTHQTTRVHSPDHSSTLTRSTRTDLLEYTHQITRTRPPDHLLDLHLSKNSQSASCFRSISRSVFKGHRSSTKIILSGIRATSCQVVSLHNCSPSVVFRFAVSVTVKIPNKYAPQAPNRTPPANATAQELAVREKKPISHQYFATKERSDHKKSLALKEQKESLKNNPIAEEELKNEVLKILNAYNKPKKAKCALSSPSKKAKLPLPTEIVNDTCDLPEKPEFVLEDDQACEKLTQLEPVHPSSIVSISQVIPSKIKCLLQEFEENNPGGLPPFFGLEHQFLDESGESSKTFLYIIQSKQGKKHGLTDTTTQRYEFLAIPNDRLLDFEQAKESYDSHDGIKDVFQPYDQFAYRTKGFMLDKIKLFELNCFLNDSMCEFDNLSRIAYCISYVKTKEAFSVSYPFTEGFDILVYNQIFDDHAKFLKSCLDDLSKNLFVEVKKYTFCTYDPVFRVSVVKAQVIQSEGMKAHAPETWLFNLWLMRFTVQVDYDPCEQLRNEQDEWQGNKRQCRMIFDPGGCFWIQMKCFPNNKQIQLTPRSNFPFQIFEPTREKAYDQSLQGKYNLSLSFNFSNLIPFVAEEADLRTNLFQEGGDDVIMDSSDNGDMELLEPEELGAKEQLGDGANGAKEDVALHISNGPMTRSKTRLLNQAITTLLHQIQGSLKQDACPATLVVIQAVQATTMENQAWKFKGIPQPLEVLFDPSSSSPLDLTRFTPPDPPEQTYSSTLTRPLEYTHQTTRVHSPDHSSTLTRSTRTDLLEEVNQWNEEILELYKVVEYYDQELASNGDLGDNPLADLGEIAEGEDKREDEFLAKLADAETPLYPDCLNHSKLSAIVSLFRLKTKNGWSDKSFDELLETLPKMLPKGNVLHTSLYDVKKFLKSFDMGYEKIYACVNDCCLFRKKYKKLENYPKCNASRWKINMHTGEVKKGFYTFGTNLEIMDHSGAKPRSYAARAIQRRKYVQVSNDTTPGGLKDFNHNNQMYDFYESVERHHQGVDRHHTGNRPITLGDYNRSDLFYENRRAIRPPAFERSDDLGLQPAFYTLVSQYPFHGLPHEQPMDHIERFEDLVSIIKARVVSEDYLLCRLFSYSLVGEAASWLKELIPGSLTTWQQTKMAFLRNFTKNYSSSSHQALPPPASIRKIESMLEQIQESMQRTLEQLPRIENNLTPACHVVLMESEDEFVAVEENDDDFVVAELDHSTHSLSVDRYHLGVDRHSSDTEEESTFDEAESSELDTEESTPDSSVDRHSPSVDRHWTRTAPYALVFPPPSKKSELERRDDECRLKLVSLLYALPFDDCCKLQDPLQDYIAKMITNGISAEDVSLLIKDSSAILVYQDPEKKPNKRQSVAISELVSAMIQCSILEKLPDPESFVLDCSISTYITVGYVKELDSIEQVKLQASQLEDWSGDNLFSTKMQDEAQIGDKLLQIAEPHCRNSTKFRAANSVSIDTTMVSVDTSFDETDLCRPHHLAVDTKRTAVTSTTAPLLLHPPPKKQRYSRPPPKPPDLINKNLKFFNTVSRLSKPRVSRRALVRSFDDCVGKRSIPPIPKSRPADVTYFFGRPHTPTAYTPPWMMRRFSRKYLLPPSDPPDA
ncbi:hypothetical protein ISN45_Aa02g009840 [Arabidopsis thaliana x Arabidopsis arenosa]|uniref:Retrotransposon gag domain-containing protein n=1 Tax=Arabidopsis thaliana x Arabidopsis arenosa TaxID=1240361 RepID=A0A8T2BGP8_9BRAS|nr:hypothetical protein ISN45_Aa02g009840 [Arabidopsis thaliana x Arabidopsis arenosa]